jgi:hypothetical protein
VSIPRALLLALALLQAVGIADYMRRVACEQECKSDGCGDEAPCDGSTCACHCPGVPSTTAPALAAIDATPPKISAAMAFLEHDDLRGSPDPREILHVPRSVRV